SATRNSDDGCGRPSFLGPRTSPPRHCRARVDSYGSWRGLGLNSAFYNECVSEYRLRDGMGTPTASLADHNTIGWRFDNSYARLPGVLFPPARTAAFREPRVAILNHRLAEELGLDLGAVPPASAAALFAGQELPAGALPIAQAYAGHQFGHFTM